MPRSFSDAFDIGRSLSAGFSMLKVAPLPLLVGAVLVQCTQGGSSGVGNNLGSGGSGGDSSWDSSGGLDWEPGKGMNWDDLMQSLGIEVTAALVVAILVAALCVLLVVTALFLLNCWVTPGYYRTHLTVAATGAADFGPLFGAKDAFTRMIVWRLLKGVIVLGISMVTGLPGLIALLVGVFKGSVMAIVLGVLLLLVLLVPATVYVGLGLYFGDRLVALDGYKAMPALERSWALADGNRLWLFLFQLVMGLVGALGVCACFVGVFVTGAIVEAGATLAFLRYTRDEAETSRYWISQQP